MNEVKSAFDSRLLTLATSQLLPSRIIPASTLSSPKYLTILASVRELGIIEPIAIHHEPIDLNEQPSRYLVLDGHLRLAALKQLSARHALCMLSTDDEGFTYNRQISRLTPIQESKMITQAIERGVSAERIAEVLNISLDRIQLRQNLLKGIAKEAIELLKTRMVSQPVFHALRKMKPMRQIEAAEMMISANCYTGRYAQMVLTATRPEDLLETKTSVEGVSPENIVKMEREMERLYHDYRLVEDTLGETMLVLVVAKGYLTRILRNDSISAYLQRFEPDLARELMGIMDAVTADARNLERE
ncbi:plasmid partitioning protein RepB C-terminal domain-containing protein [Pseudomonas putida]|uniref:plasmid partitioning protein RepB C-terminal domain-containing protein n=1 Tax=Pseudomonas TaxID=286 RepID=UPI00107512F6|nr:plasmid partitioning protein RepB C-terminal domain-containing protein [Pseudomonas putida]MCG3646522.1 ParB N-terminal domain-containing protein [Pseudomonas putida]MDD2076802.1 ParB N-terminal domain-containing protein [Pseudomonas putida]TFW19249.1 chromosome partitioning protein [Pseudomonas putida]HDS0978139.1 ParB N-terminal domain-containing protein [Pseudomonas putida]HDS1693015.1 ParB N-terminal domain-containing protein [Pseudomonas putida]